jgi:hypothetical protein
MFFAGILSRHQMKGWFRNGCSMFSSSRLFEEVDRYLINGDWQKREPE